MSGTGASTDAESRAGAAGTEVEQGPTRNPHEGSLRSDGTILNLDCGVDGTILGINKNH